MDESVKAVDVQPKKRSLRHTLEHGYMKAGVVVGTLLLSTGANAALTQPDVSEATGYIEGLTSGAGFEIATAGLMMTIGIRGLKRIRGAF